MSEPGIRLFRELKLSSPSGVGALKQALVVSADRPWIHSIEDEEQLYRAYPPGITVALFTREESRGVEPCMLTLLQDLDSLKLTNILPRKIPELGPARYNALIKDFLLKVVQPARELVDIKVGIGDEFLSLQTLLGPGAASALVAFSNGANKATGSSHPLDRKRWFDFILAVDRSPRRPDLEQVLRWLVEAEGWSEETALELIRECQFGLELLQHRVKRTS
ncbi:hypothetical protein ACQKEF_21065 [Pseudomonas oryzihabitans]|uniref:hypothetical protein n=1 Tax=Pseudomonas oryzihabitans TaxID=47885 RepID=UPI003D055D89